MDKHMELSFKTVAISLVMFAFGMLVLFGTVGCNREDPIVQKSQFVSLGGPALISYQEITIEGCQYLCYDRSFTHKGNCTNTIHVYRLENK